MYAGIAVNFRGRGLKNLCLHPFLPSQTKHVDLAMHAGLRRLDGVVLIVNWRCGTGEIIDLINFQIDRERDVMSNKLEAFVVEEMLDIDARSSKEIVQANDFRPF